MSGHFMKVQYLLCLRGNRIQYRTQYSIYGKPLQCPNTYGRFHKTNMLTVCPHKVHTLSIDYSLLSQRRTQ